MIEKGKREQKIDEIIKLASFLLKVLDEKKISANEAQSALGNAWIRLLVGMGLPKHEFEKLVEILIDLYPNKPHTQGEKND